MKNKDRRAEHKKIKELAFHQKKIIARAFEEIRKYEESKESEE